jgi:hypothetical protein
MGDLQDIVRGLQATGVGLAILEENSPAHAAA